MGYDIAIEHSDRKVGFNLSKDGETGLLVWRPGLAPELSPQVNQANYSYGSIPPQIAVIRAVEDWHAGGGYKDAEETSDHESHAGHRYSHARGVDASWGGLRLSFERQTLLESDATAIAAAPDFYSRTADGLFMVAGTVIYEYVSAAWLARKTMPGSGTGPIVDFNGTGFAPCGDSAAYVYSTDGITWTTVTTLADLYAQFFVVRGQTSGAAVLWKITSTGALKNNTSGLLGGGVEWSSAVQVGGTGETVTGMVVMDGDIIVFKTDGIYSYDGTNTTKIWDGGRLMHRSNNGSNPVIWSDGNAYTTYGDTLVQFDNVNTKVSAVWPTAESLGNSEINGQITALAASVGHIFFALKNSAGNTYIMKGNPSHGFHPVAYLGANDCDALLFVGPGDLHANNPCLVIGYGTAGHYYIYPRSGLLPEDDGNVEFDTSGYIIGGLDGVNAKGFTKFLNLGLVLADNLATGRTAELLYEADESGTYVSVLTASADGKTENDIDATVEFNQYRYRVSLTSNSSTETPIVDSVVFSASLNNPRKRMWQFSVDIGEGIPPATGGDVRASAKDMEAHLFAAKNKRCYLYDLSGAKHRARLLDIDGGGATRESSGKFKQSFQATMVEV